MRPAEFFDWWGSELSELVPPQVRSRLGRNRCVLVLALEQPDAIRVSASVEGEPRELGSLPLSAGEEPRHALRAFIRELHQRPDRVELHLPPGRFIAREVSLPLAAEGNLRDAIGFQIDRLTPFTADQVNYHCGVSERLPNEKRLKAWLTVTPKEPLERALKLVAELQPMPARPPRQAPAAGQPLVIGYRPKAAIQSGRSPILWGLVLLNLALFGTGAYLHVDNRLEQRDRMLAELRAVQARAQVASELNDRIEGIREQASALFTRRTTSPLMVEVIEDLTARLSDGTWLQRFEAKNGRLKLQGVSNAASTLIGQLEESPMLADVRFDASITRDNRTGGERFSVSGQIVKPDEPFVPPPIGLEEAAELADGGMETSQ